MQLSIIAVHRVGSQSQGANSRQWTQILVIPLQGLIFVAVDVHIVEEEFSEARHRGEAVGEELLHKWLLLIDEKIKIHFGKYLAYLIIARPGESKSLQQRKAVAQQQIKWFVVGHRKIADVQMGKRRNLATAEYFGKEAAFVMMVQNPQTSAAR